MRTTYLTYILTTILLLTLGCAEKKSDRVRVQWSTMGTIAGINSRDMQTNDEVRQLASHVFEQINQQFSIWDTNSVISQINARAGSQTPTPVSDDIARLFQISGAYCQASQGAFNPLIGGLMTLWGFNGASPITAPPTTQALTQALQLTQWESVTLCPTKTPATLYLTQPGMILDFGAIAKGFAVDQAWQAIKQKRYKNVLIDLGGNLRAIGEAAPGRGGWLTGVRDPFAPGALLATFMLKDGEATATSGNYERFVEIKGVRYAHILDGRTGKPVTGMAGVTVIAPDALTSDALSTSLFILGIKQGGAMLKNYPNCEALWIPDTPDHPVIHATPGFAKRLTIIAKTPVPLHITL